MLCLKTWLYPVWKLVYTMYEDITNLYSNFFGDLSALYFKVFLHNEWRHVYTKTPSWWHFYKIDQIGHVEENGQWVKIQKNLVQKASNLTMIFQGFKTIESLFIWTNENISKKSNLPQGNHYCPPRNLWSSWVKCPKLFAHVQTLKVGSWDLLCQMPTVMAKFV